MKSQEIVLIYEWEKERKTQFQRFCEERKIKVKEVPVSLYSESLGTLAEISGISQSGKKDIGQPFGEEMMVFSGMDGKRLEIFLDEYQREGLKPIQLKAIMTPYNIFWNSRQLYEELKKERELFLHR